MPKSWAVYKISGSKPPYIRMTKNSNKQFENIRCTICMETPHNATLLVCSSREKGCRAYMCSTPIQSDCLARYRTTSASASGATSSSIGLRCPLCRGHVSEERRVEERAHLFMDQKPRECKIESCGFSGARRELMWHWWGHRGGDNVVEEDRERVRREREWERVEREWDMRAIEGLIGMIFVPLRHATSAEDAALSATSASGDGGGPQIRRGARMSVAGHLVGRQLARPSIPAVCL